MAKRILHLRALNQHSRYQIIKNEGHCQHVFSLLSRCFSQNSEEEIGGKVATSNEEVHCSSPIKRGHEHYCNESEHVMNSRDNDELRSKRWKLDIDWLPKLLVSFFPLNKRASNSGNDAEKNIPSSNRSFTEIIAHIQSSNVGIADWSLSELTVGLYLMYVSQSSSSGKVEDFNGLQIFSDTLVEELIYYIELAKGAYKENAACLARHSMLSERNILKFVKDSSVMRPGYYVGIDTRKKLVILGIRGTHTVYDLITNVLSTSNEEVAFEGFSTHFGTAEAARWYLRYEMGTIRKCMEEHKGFRLRLVGHSLGGAAAALLAIMLRKKPEKELGFSPENVSAIGFGTPPCVSQELAKSCAGYVSTIVLQDDIIPRLSVASLARLRNEVLETDWRSVLEKEDWKGVVDLVTNAKQVVSLVHDVSLKLADYAKFSKTPSDGLRKRDSAPATGTRSVSRSDRADQKLFIPGTVYFLKRKTDKDVAGGRSTESYSLWKGQPGEYSQRILLSGNLISDHKCDSHYYALRDVLKSLPGDERVEL